MDWVKYYQDQINKSNYNRLNKVEDFTGNQTKGQEGGFYPFIPIWVIKKLVQDNQNEKVENFTGNQTGGFSFFAREFGTFIGKKNYAFRKWIDPKGIQALEEHLERVKEEEKNS